MTTSVDQSATTPEAMLPSGPFCFFDTETSDMIKFKLPNSDPSQPWICQVAAVVMDETQRPLHQMCFIVHSHGLPMSPEAADVHKISIELCDSVGIQSGAAFGMLLNLFDASRTLVAHNAQFDLRMLKIVAHRIHEDAHTDLEALLADRPVICTMQRTTKFCQLPFPSGRNGYKWPKLEELYYKLFGTHMEHAHDALGDVRATAKCFFELKSRGIL